jgi:hypothetical protein
LLQSPLLAQSGHLSLSSRCPLLGVKRTSVESGAMSAFDPKRTSATDVILIGIKQDRGTACQASRA